ncbi:MAG: ribosomal RNA small subunit methyltransferase A, partial [Planctomycetota bacterium]
PYSIATPFLANLLWEGLPVSDVVALVQLEAAERFLARPRTRQYGPMSVAVSLLARADLLRRVGPQVFWPVPKVESALVRVSPLDPSRARAWNAAGLPTLLRAGFRHRRKTLRKSFPESRLRAAGLDPSARPEEVPPDGWVRLLGAAA